jgi:hypothetical protein
MGNVVEVDCIPVPVTVLPSKYSVITIETIFMLEFVYRESLARSIQMSHKSSSAE